MLPRYYSADSVHRRKLRRRRYRNSRPFAGSTSLASRRPLFSLVYSRTSPLPEADRSLWALGILGILTGVGAPVVSLLAAAAGARPDLSLASGLVSAILSLVFFGALFVRAMSMGRDDHARGV